jgi:5-methyltetrahydropteroyltriglutamate--homocysteine methyltransferase
MTTTILGYPRIYARPELKFVTEGYGAGRGCAAELATTAAGLRRAVWAELRDAGLDAIPSNTFSFYDHVLDTSVMIDAVPGRYRGLSVLDRYFAMARGTADTPALEMTKWFDTNYHYIVPELTLDVRFRLADGGQAKPVAEYLEAKGLGIETRPVLIGPLTYLMLAKPAAGSPEGGSSGAGDDREAGCDAEQAFPRWQGRGYGPFDIA